MPRPAGPAGTSAALAFAHVTVVDVTDGTLRPDQTVVIRGTRVQAVGRTGRVRVPRDARIVEARGKYLMPGLWDMELYLGAFSEPLMQLLIATGVTGIRHLGVKGGGVLGGEHVTIDSLLRWRREVATGTRAGPRLLIGTPRIDGCRSAADSAGRSTNPCTPERARFLVDSLQAAGADHIFVYSQWPMRRENFFAILAEARRRRIPVVGHLPQLARTEAEADALMPLVEASDSGMHAVDHMMGTDGVCRNESIVDSATVEKCARLAARLRRSNTWLAIGPLLPFRGPARLTEEEFRRRFQFHPRRLRGDSPESKPLLQRGDQDPLPRDYFTIAARADLPLLVASDQGAVAGHQVGFSLHDQLAVAVEHGLTPLAALQAATLNPAKYLGGTDSLGTVAAGKLADLVLLDANPLADITNTTQIRAVVANGRYFDRAALDRLLAQAGAAP